MDQSYKKYMGVKLIEAYPCEKWIDGVKHEGYAVKYPDGYESWSPKKQFESAYLQLDGDGSTVTPRMLEDFIANVSVQRIDPKTSVVCAQMTTGFMQYATSSCVDPKNYDEKIGKEIGMREIKSKLWFALGFVLQWAKNGITSNKEGVNGLQENT